jgi:hypothetical protein
LAFTGEPQAVTADDREDFGDRENSDGASPIYFS